MVGFTYQDYLKYHKYLKKRKKKEKEFTYEEKKKNEEWTESFIRMLKLAYENKESDMVMEEEEPYILLESLDEREKKENTQIRKIHDELFRDILNNKEEFMWFLNSFIKLDINITKDELEKYNRRFVTEEYKSKFSDVVYKIKNENIFFLVEHQSSIDYSMPYRMLTYCYEIMRDAIDKTRLKDKNYKLPIVVPILLYTGNRKWRVPEYIHTIHSMSIGISMRYEIIDAHNYKKERLLSSNSMIGFTMEAERSKTEEEFEDALKAMIENKPNEIDTIVSIMKYVYKDRLSDEEIEDIYKKIKNGEVSEIMTTIRTRLAQNDKKILKEGIEQGTLLMAELVAKRMLSNGINKETIQKITELSVEKLEEIEKHLMTKN